MLDPEILAGITAGAVDKITESGAVLVGGHTTEDAEPKFGLSVTGRVHPDRVWRNSGAREGDLLILTKPIGTGVILAAEMQMAAPGDVVARAAFSVAESLATELRVRSEIERRLSSFAAPAPTDIGSAAREELRESYAEIRSIAAAISDESVKRRLQTIERRLAALSGDRSAATLDIRLSPREVDVLASVAVGATNAEVAASLGLREGTVKSYLQSAMSKLDVSTRHAAVTKARRAGILP